MFPDRSIKDPLRLNLLLEDFANVLEPMTRMGLAQKSKL